MVWLGQLIVLGPFAYDLDIAQFGADDWFFRSWAAIVAAWIFTRLCTWRITADANGLCVTGFWKTEHIPWGRVDEAICRRDGCVAVKDRMVGPFLPPRLARILRRPATVETVADHLTVTSRHPELRPPRQREQALAVCPTPRGRPSPWQ